MQVALRGMWGRKLRTILTAISIVLGTCMITGTFVIRDQITNAFTQIFDEGNKGIDVVLSKQTAFTSQNAEAGPLPASVIDQARQVDGVLKAEGQIQALGALVIDNKAVTSSSGAPNLVISSVDEPFANTDFTAGGPPSTNTVAINQKLADDKDLKVGQHVGLATEVGIKPVTISGIFKLNGVSSIGGATIVVPTFSDAQAWFNRTDQTSVVYLQAEPGVSPTELKQRVKAALPATVKVQTGAENAKEQANEISDGINGFLTPLLLAFAFAAVFVGLFIIFNTFSITVAQRMREFAMLRTLGASRNQVLRSVLVEAALMGLIASLVGIALGVLFAKGLGALFDAAGFGLPKAPIQVPLVGGIVLPLAVGVLSATLASLAPAFRATRVPPIAALREGFVLAPGRFSHWASPAGAVVALGGIGLIGLAIRSNGSTTRVLAMMAAGAILAFIGVAMLSKLLVKPAAAGLGLALIGVLWVARLLGRVRDAVPGVGPVLRWIGYGLTLGWVWATLITVAVVLLILAISSSTGALVGALIVLVLGGGLAALLWFKRPRDWPWDPASPTSGRLAEENTTRNPGRTAVTAAALMIGVALVVFVAVFVNGFKESFLGALDRSLTSDLIIQSESFSPIPAEAVDAAAKVPGVKTSTGIQFTDAKINNGGTDTVNGVDPVSFGGVYKFDWLKGGSDELLTGLGNHDALIEEQFAKSHKLEPGDSFNITSIDGNTLHLKVAGEYKDPVLMTGLIIPEQTFNTFAPGSKDPGVMLVNFTDDAQGAAAQQAVTAALKQFPAAKVRTNAEYKQNTEDQVNQFLGLLYALLLMCVIVALIGIVNTLALSVFERTREIGMLRAVGMTRRQLRRVIRYESVITAIIGGVLGILVGVLFGWVVSQGLSDQGVIFAVPWSQLLLCLIVASVVGLLAAILPARRAAKLDVLEALQYE